MHAPIADRGIQRGLWPLGDLVRPVVTVVRNPNFVRLVSEKLAVADCSICDFSRTDPPELPTGVAPANRLAIAKNEAGSGSTAGTSSANG